MDRSLDEIIAEDPNRSSRPSGGGGGRRNQGRGRRDRGDGVRKPYSQDRVDLNLDWVHDKFDDSRDGRPSRGPRRSHRSASAERGGRALTKVRVENLHYDITENDLQSLFGDIGPVTKLEILYDRAGRSEGVALITYTFLRDAKKSVEEFHKANAKGQPIYLSLVRDSRDRDSDRPTLFDRVERPRDARSLSPGGDDERRPVRGRGRRSDVTKPAPDHIDRYIPGQRSPARRAGGRRGGREPRQRNTENGGGRRGGNARPRKTQEELDQEMEDYWGNGDGAEKEVSQDQAAPAAAAEPAPVSAPAPAGDDDIDMIE